MVVKKPVKVGCDFLRDSNFEPRIMTEKQAQAYGKKMAKTMLPKGFWNTVVIECDDYFRIKHGGQKYKRS